MSIISTIDCTLRDGGYLNNWEFNDEFLIETLKTLIKSKVEIIECGFISELSGNDDSGTHFKSIEKINNILKSSKLNNSTSKYAVMLKAGEYTPENLPNCNLSENTVSIIRLMFHKNETNEAYNIAGKILEKGYKIHIQPTIISHYTDEEVVSMLNKLRLINYEAISIVDTFGALNEEEIKRITLLFDKYANKEAKLAIHCHNNLSIAYQNVIAFSNSVSSHRDIVIDCSINGIGRGGGNLQTEILLTWLKNEKSSNYSISPLKTFCDSKMKFFKSIIPQEHLYAYTITAKKNMHPNYATWLILRGFQRKDIQKILELIIPEKYETFDFQYIKSLCDIYLLKV